VPSNALGPFAGANEIRISSRRPDGSLRAAIPIWGVVVDDALYVRSQAGPTNGWYRRALDSGTGRIRAGDTQLDVTFAEATDADHAGIDAAYRKKYGYFGNIDGILGPERWAVTLIVVPAG
jgi:hypothetical protein